MTSLLVPAAEYAFGADRTAHPTSWPWADMADPATRPAGTTGRLRTAQPVLIRVGRQDEASIVQPSGVSVTLDNSDGHLTPRKAISPWHPHNGKRGTPGRIVIPAGLPALYTSGAAGSRAGTPDAPSLDVTGDQSWIVELWPPIFIPPPGVNYEIYGKFNVTGSQRSALLFLDAAGLLHLRWSTDGTGPGELNAVTAVAVPVPPWGPLSAGAFLDVNSGGGNRSTTFYALHGDLLELVADKDAAVLDVDTDSGTTSVFPSTATLDVGDVTGSGFSPYPGFIARARYVAGDVDGADIRANPDFTTMEPGDTQHTDSEGLLWTVQGNAEVTDRKIRITGETNRWAPAFPGRKVSGLATVQADTAGILRRLRQGKDALNSALVRLITSPQNQGSVPAYWPCEDGRDATTAASPIPGVAPMTLAMAKAADDTLIGSLPVANAPGGQPFGWHGIVPDHTVGTKWAVDWFVRIPEAAATLDAGPVMIVRTSTDREYRLSVDTDEWRNQIVSGNAVISTSTALNQPEFFTGWSLLRLEAVQNGGNVDWDWTWWWIPPTVAPFGLLMSGSFAGTLGRVTDVANLHPAAPPDGISIGHITVSVDKDFGWMAPADTGFVGETAGTRVRRLCAEENIPLTILGDVDDTAPMGPQRALTLPALLQECADADLGILAEDRFDLGLVYRARHTLYNQSPKMVIDAGLDNPLGPTHDDQRLRNDIKVTRTDGSSFRAVDQEAIDGSERGEGLYDSGVTINVATDDQLPDQANWRLHQGVWPEMRYPTVTVMLEKDDPLIDDWVNVGPGDRIRIVDLPAELDSDTVDLIVEGWSETIRPETWTLTLNCSPAGVWDVGVVGTLADVDADLARVATADTELGSGIDDNDLSLSLATTGRVWITTATHPDHFPVDLEIGGEVLTISGITGTSSPQTATVSARSVNGVVKSHSAGAAVQVAKPIRIAL